MNILLPLEFRLARFCAHRRAACLRLFGIAVGRGSSVARGARVARTWLNGGYGAVAIGDNCDIRQHAVLESWGGRIAIGRNCFIGPHAVIYGHGGVDIGHDVLISMHVRILSSNHGIPGMSRKIRGEPDVLQPTRIGSDVWLGAGVTVLGGVVIGDGCVVGAGAVVTKDLPAGAIAHGVPATVRSFRAGSVPPQ